MRVLFACTHVSQSIEPHGSLDCLFPSGEVSWPSCPPGEGGPQGRPLEDAQDDALALMSVLSNRHEACGQPASLILSAASPPAYHQQLTCTRRAGRCGGESLARNAARPSYMTVCTAIPLSSGRNTRPGFLRSALVLHIFTSLTARSEEEIARKMVGRRHVHLVITAAVGVVNKPADHSGIHAFGVYWTVGQRL